MSKNVLRSAIHQALRASGVAGTGLTLGCLALPAGAQNAAPANNQPQTLQTIVVTGSHIRRVDLETSNPVIAITSQQIQATGKLTLGDVIQNLPVIAGGVENSNVNNGGGSGQTQVGLRGLGAQRTLVLVDGQRVLGSPFPFGNGAVNLNMIPADAVERIEVLTDGASAVYGSDAIGGVINIVLKSNYQGAQFSANYGISDHDDGQREGASFTFGESSDKGSILAGADYNKFDAVLQSARKFSANALSITGTNNGAPRAAIGGSTFAARDLITIPAGIAQAFGCPTGGSLALNPGATGTSPTNATDYHCFGTSDKYNFAAVNQIMTPNQRTSGFFKGVYHLTDNIDAYATVFHTKTDAGSQLAPAVFGTPTGVSISKNSYYNPFGIDFTPSNGNEYRSRMFPAGNRVTRDGVSQDQVMLGLRGNVNLFSQNWTWDVGYDYGHFSDLHVTSGLPNQTVLQPGLGPSFLNAQGVVQCGTAAAPIALSQCTPWDPFNLFSPSATAVVPTASAAALTDTWAIERTTHADISGGLFDLPAGTVQLAAGASYRKEYVNNTVDPVLIIDPVTLNCTLGSQCSAHLQGGYAVKEVYAEAFIPVLKDLPFIHALNVTLGDRYSKYSDFGSTNNWKAAVEYRPIEDLLLRGTISSIFRAPTVNDIFAAPTTSAPLLSSDPCNFTASTPTTPNPNAGNPACVGVPATGTFIDQQVKNSQQIQAVNAGSQFAHFPLGPESGKSFDYGAVYSPHFVPGLSLSADIWRVFLNNTITTVGAQTVLDQCFAGVLAYCPSINRFAANTASPGQIKSMIQPTANLGRIDVKGLDVSGQYKLPQFSFGQFTLGLAATYLTQFKIQTAPGLAGNKVFNAVGVMGSNGSALVSSCPAAAGAVCFFPRIRAQGSVDWQLGAWDASWRMRYISKFKVGSADLSQGATAFAGIPGYVLHFGSYVYNDLTVGYNIEPLNARISLGVDNVFDKQPPLLYANNALNANTDPADFDVLGRFYWARLTVKF